MNVHSHSRLRSHDPLLSPIDPYTRRAATPSATPASSTAAERAFVRHGLSRHHHAARGGRSRHERGQSLPLFPLQGSDRRRPLSRTITISAPTNFAASARGADLVEALGATLREHVLGAPPEKARLIVEIWAEAGRNPRIAQIIARDSTPTSSSGLRELLAEAPRPRARLGGESRPGFRRARRCLRWSRASSSGWRSSRRFRPRARGRDRRWRFLKGLFAGALAPAAAPIRRRRPDVCGSRSRCSSLLAALLAGACRLRRKASRPARRRWPTLNKVGAASASVTCPRRRSPRRMPCARSNLPP